MLPASSSPRRTPGTPSAVTVLTHRAGCWRALPGDGGPAGPAPHVARGRRPTPHCQLHGALSLSGSPHRPRHGALSRFSAQGGSQFALDWCRGAFCDTGCRGTHRNGDHSGQGTVGEQRGHRVREATPRPATVEQWPGAALRASGGVDGGRQPYSRTAKLSRSRSRRRLADRWRVATSLTLPAARPLRCLNLVAIV